MLYPFRQGSILLTVTVKEDFLVMNKSTNSFKVVSTGMAIPTRAPKSAFWLLINEAKTFHVVISSSVFLFNIGGPLLILLLWFNLVDPPPRLN